MDTSAFLNMYQELLDRETNVVASLANSAAYLYTNLQDINWAGFYLKHGDELLLGPFCGKPAVTRIAFGNGVCGTAWKENKTIVVENVHCFAGHIACDCASNSEIVVPIQKDNAFYGVLDIDSPDLGRFKEEDKTLLEEFVRIFEKHIN